MSQTSTIAVSLLLPCAALCQMLPVSVRQSRPQPDNTVFFPFLGSTVQLRGKQVIVSGSLVGLIMTAYNVKEYQVVGGQDWVDHGQLQRYDIAIAMQAKGNALLDRVQRMLQSILADSFHLTFHREMRDILAYGLVLSEGGPKFKLGPAGVSTGLSPVFFSSRKYNTGLSVPDLVHLLAREVHYPVRDMTGVSGIFDFAESLYDPPEKAVFAEVQDQLGLQLIPATETTEILIVDHAKRPVEN